VLLKFILCLWCRLCVVMIIDVLTCNLNVNIQEHTSKESVLQTVPSAHIVTAAASTTVHNKPAGTSLPSPPVSLQVPATNPAMESPIGFTAGQMYPSSFPPQLWSGVTPSSE